MNQPEQIKISEDSPLVGALQFFGGLSDALLHPLSEQTRRSEALTDEFDGITVDTCSTNDTHKWETGIKREQIEGKWIIVSQYHNKEEAEEGHKKWVEYIKENPACELRDIDLWNLKEGRIL